MLKQVRTVLDDLQMVEVNEGVLDIVSIRMYRHAGDPVEKDLWFPVVTVEAKGTEGGTIHMDFVHKEHLDHGQNKGVICHFIGSLFLKGKINLYYWKHQSNN